MKRSRLLDVQKGVWRQGLNRPWHIFKSYPLPHSRPFNEGIASRASYQSFCMGFAQIPSQFKHNTRIARILKKNWENGGSESIVRSWRRSGKEDVPGTALWKYGEISELNLKVLHGSDQCIVPSAIVAWIGLVFSENKGRGILL